MGAPLPESVCGNGVIEGPPEFSGRAEQCDGHLIPAGVPAGSACNSECMLVLPSDTCLSCVQRNCPTQFENAFGSASSAQNLEAITLLFDCVIGPQWELGGSIPPTSCFFSDPSQPSGSLLPCYCGSTPQATCLANGPLDNQEACGLEIELASLCNPPLASCVTSSGSDPSTPLGDALQVLNCERAACRQACGFNIIIDVE
jgi:hypothetical protein